MIQQLLNAVVLGSIYALFSLGLSLAWGVANVLNLAHGSLFVLGALTAYELGSLAAIPLWIMLPLSALAGGVGAMILDIIAFTPITKRTPNPAKRELAVILASLGGGAIVVNIANVLTDFMVQRVPEGVFTVTTYNIGDIYISNIAIIVIVIALLVTAAIVLWVRLSAHGRAVRAVAFDRSLAQLFGANSTLLSRVMLVVGGALAGGAGLLLAIQLSAFDPYFGNSLLLKAFAAVIIGGIGSIGGTVIAGYLLAGVETFIIAYAPPQVPFDAVTFVIIILALMIMPQGIFRTLQADRA